MTASVDRGSPPSSPRSGARRGLRAVGLLGPAFVAAIAYADPGNVAANVTAGARTGYLLVWVLIAASAAAAIVQYSSARLGLVTGRSLPELLGDRLPRPARLAFFAQAEIVAAATDIAEVIGGALALRLLFGLPLLAGGLLVGAVSLALLGLQSWRGQRTFETVVVGLLAVLAIGFASGVVAGGVDWGAAAAGTVPRFAGTESVVLAASMLGATVMPHVVYLHSALARDRHGRTTDASRLRQLLAATRLDVGLALVVAGAVNVALLLLAAAHLQGAAGTATIQGAHRAITLALGPAVGVLFAIGLLASGLASSSVGAYAGGVISSGLLRVRIPLAAQRAVTLVPALVLLALGGEPTAILVGSQVVLSFGIPFALVPLVHLNADRALMGSLAAGPALRIAGWLVTMLVIVLNAVLIVLLTAG